MAARRSEAAERALRDRRRRLAGELMLVDFELEADPAAFDVGMAVWDWLKRQRDWDLTYDAHIYSRYRWDQLRNEPHGRDAIFTITTEGPLGRTLNYPEQAADYRLIDRFARMVADLGIFYEMGYSWSLHFYPVS